MHWDTLNLYAIFSVLTIDDNTDIFLGANAPLGPASSEGLCVCMSVYVCMSVCLSVCNTLPPLPSYTFFVHIASLLERSCYSFYQTFTNKRFHEKGSGDVSDVCVQRDK